jgi:hypothetical protein
VSPPSPPTCRRRSPSPASTPSPPMRRRPSMALATSLSPDVSALVPVPRLYSLSSHAPMPVHGPGHLPLATPLFSPHWNRSTGEERWRGEERRPRPAKAPARPSLPYLAQIHQHRTDRPRPP